MDADDDWSGELKKWIKDKLKSYTFPGLLFLLSTYLLKASLAKISEGLDTIAAGAFGLAVFFVILLVSVLVYIIRILIHELGRKARVTEELERKLLKKRKSTKEGKDNDE